MSEARKDTERATKAAQAIVDRRTDAAAIMVTLEHTVAAVLLATCAGDPRKAVGMLNEALVQGVEQRLSDFVAGKTGRG